MRQSHKYWSIKKVTELLHSLENLSPRKGWEWHPLLPTDCFKFEEQSFWQQRYNGQPDLSHILAECYNGRCGEGCAQINTKISLLFQSFCQRFLLFISDKINANQDQKSAEGIPKCELFAVENSPNYCNHGK